jgi:hypothetical protein
MQPRFSHNDNVLDALHSAYPAYIDLILGVAVDPPLLPPSRNVWAPLAAPYYPLCCRAY